MACSHPRFTPRVGGPSDTGGVEVDAGVDPYVLLAEHPDISLGFTRLPDGERGRWYPDLHVILIDDRLTQAQRRCTLMHELVHRMRNDGHVLDPVLEARQEKACHETVARLLIPMHELRNAMQWGRDPQELADELWVDLDTLQARIKGLSAVEAAMLTEGLDETLEETA
jgi:hypothetical protein